MICCAPSKYGYSLLPMKESTVRRRFRSAQGLAKVTARTLPKLSSKSELKVIDRRRATSSSENENTTSTLLTDEAKRQDEASTKISRWLRCRRQKHLFWSCRLQETVYIPRLIWEEACPFLDALCLITDAQLFICEQIVCFHVIELTTELLGAFHEVLSNESLSGITLFLRCINGSNLGLEDISLLGSTLDKQSVDQSYVRHTLRNAKFTSPSSVYKTSPPEDQRQKPPRRAYRLEKLFSFLLDIKSDVLLLQHLQCLHLNRNNLPTFPVWTLHLPQLRILTLRQNRIRQLPAGAWVRGAQSLEVLDVRNNRIEELPIAIAALYRRRCEILLVGNPLRFPWLSERERKDDSHGRVLSLVSDRYLKRLDNIVKEVEASISSNNLPICTDGKGTLTFASGETDWRNATKNRSGDYEALFQWEESLRAVVQESGMLLKKLFLCGVDLFVIPLEICQIASLAELCFDKSRVVKVRQEITLLSRLRRLSLCSIPLTLSIHPSVGGMKELKELDTRGTNVIGIPPDVTSAGGTTTCRYYKVGWAIVNQNCDNFALLDNFALRLIPSFVFSVEGLSSISLRDNRIESLAGLSLLSSSLTVLNVANNLLQTSALSSLGALTNLTQLDLERNRGVFYLPSALQALTKLRRLALNGCSIRSEFVEMAEEDPQMTIHYLTRVFASPMETPRGKYSQKVLLQDSPAAELEVQQNTGNWLLSGPSAASITIYNNESVCSDHELTLSRRPGIHFPTAIQLDRMGLKCIGAEVFSLSSYVDCLDLSYNKLTECPPKSLMTSLAYLQSLDLSHNPLFTWTAIGDALKEITALRRLALNNCQLHKVYLRDLPTSINVLLLESNELSGVFPSKGDDPSHLSSLEVLSLSQNILSTVDLKTCLSLSTLCLSGNVLKLFPAELPPSVTSIDFSKNSIVEIITGSTANLTSLVRLDVSCNLLEEIPTVFVKSLQRLTSLDVTANRLKTLPDGLGSISCLTDLKYADNPLIYPTAKLLRGGLSDLLAFLRNINNLSNDGGPRSLSLTNIGLRVVPLAVWECWKLVSLRLDRNSLRSAEGPWERLSSLRYLSLLDNPLEGLPISLGALRSSLEILSLSPESLRNYPETEWITNKNGIDNNGNLSRSLTRRLLSFLQYFYEEKHRDETTSLSRFGDGTSENRECCLRLFRLEGLQLTAFPTALAELDSIDDLSLARNEIMFLPQIPSISSRSSHQNRRGRWYENSRIVDSDLDREVSASAGIKTPDGTLFDEGTERMVLQRMNTSCRLVSVFAQLRALDLSHNCIEEVSISCLPYISRLQSLQLSHNNLKKLPSCIALLQDLRELVVDHNRLESLPEALCLLEQLQVMKIEGNSSLRSLPHYLFLCTSLEALSLDSQRMVFPPPSVASFGTRKIIVYLLRTSGIAGSGCLSSLSVRQSLKKAEERETYEVAARYCWAVARFELISLTLSDLLCETSISSSCLSSWKAELEEKQSELSGDEKTGQLSFTRLRSGYAAEQLEKVVLNDFGLIEWPFIRISSDSSSGVNVTTVKEEETDKRLCSSLSWITHLDLSHNSISVVPESAPSFANRLLTLNLRENKLQALPSWIGVCSALTLLDCSFNRISTVPKAVLNGCSSLRKLRLAANPLKQLMAKHEESQEKGNNHKRKATEKNKTTASFLSSDLEPWAFMSSIEQIDVSNCDLVELPVVIGGCTQLSVLSLAQTPIRSLPNGVIEAGGSALLKYLRLEYFAVSQNLHKTKTPLEKQDELSSLKSTSAFMVSSTLQLTSCGLAVVPLSLIINWPTTVTRLLLDNNKIQTLPERGWEAFQALEVLSLLSNPLQYLPPSLGCLWETLRVFRLPRLLFDSYPENDLIDEMKTNRWAPQTLLRFLLDIFDQQQSNALVDAQISEKTNSTSGNGEIRYVYERLFLCDRGLKKVPTTCFYLSCANLDLSDNCISEFSVPLPISEESLSAMQLSCPFLEDRRRLQQTFPLFQTIKSLSLSTNGLRALPSLIGQLRHLEELDVSNNRLEYLPLSLCGLLSLKRLVLNGNDRLCELPSFLFLCTSLSALSIDANMFRSPPPNVCSQSIEAIKRYLLAVCSASFGRLCDRKHIEQSCEGLESVIDTSFESVDDKTKYTCESADTIDTRRKRLRNRLPDESFELQINFDDLMEVFSSLLKDGNAVLLDEEQREKQRRFTANFSDLHLTVWPKELAKDEKTVSLLQPCPDGTTLGKRSTKYIQHLNLSKNRLSCLPSTSPDFTESLLSLDVSFNELEDIPDWLRRSSSLQKLDLSHNNIRCSLQSLFNGCSALVYLNVSYNQISSLTDEVHEKRRFRAGSERVLTEYAKERTEKEQLFYAFESYPTTIKVKKWSCYRSLRCLSVEHNVLETLPVELGACRRLEVLRISGNSGLTPIFNTLVERERELDVYYLLNVFYTAISSARRAEEKKIGKTNGNIETETTELTSGRPQPSLDLVEETNRADKASSSISARSIIPAAPLPSLGDRLLKVNLSGFFLTSMPSCLFHLRRVETLDLSENKLICLPESDGWKQLRCLRALYLHGNKELRQLPSSLGYCQLSLCLLTFDRSCVSTAGLSNSDETIVRIIEEVIPERYARDTVLSASDSSKKCISNSTTIPKLTSRTSKTQDSEYEEEKHFSEETVDDQIYCRSAFFAEGLILQRILSYLRALILSDGKDGQQTTNIVFDGMKLRQLPRRFFADTRAELLSSLRILSFQHNFIETIPSEIACLVSLEELYADNNRLKTLPIEVGALVQLTTFSVSHNRLTRLPPTLFRSMRSLRRIDVRGNPFLSELPLEISSALREVFVDKELYLPTKEALDAFCESLSSLFRELRSSVETGELRILREKELVSFPIRRTPLNSLRIIEIVDCGIDTLDSTDLLSFHNLEALSLDGNALHNVPNTINTLSKLKQLSLRRNQIEELPLSLCECGKLEVLSLDGNPLFFPPLKEVYKGVSHTKAYLKRFLDSARKGYIKLNLSKLRLQEVSFPRSFSSLRDGCLLLPSPICSDEETVRRREGNDVKTAVRERDGEMKVEREGQNDDEESICIDLSDNELKTAPDLFLKRADELCPHKGDLVKQNGKEFHYQSPQKKEEIQKEEGVQNFNKRNGGVVLPRTKKRLLCLDLRRNKIDELPDLLPALTNATFLWDDNPFFDRLVQYLEPKARLDSVRSLFQFMGILSRPLSLTIETLELEGLQLVQTPPFSTFVSLKRLSLAGNRLETVDLQNSALTGLNLSNNPLCANRCLFLSCRNLQSLFLCNTPITAIDREYFELCELGNLKNLRLDNSKKLEYVSSLILEYLTKLSALSLDGCDALSFPKLPSQQSMTEDDDKQLSKPLAVATSKQEKAKEMTVPAEYIASESCLLLKSVLNGLREFSAAEGVLSFKGAQLKNINVRLFEPVHYSVGLHLRYLNLDKTLVCSIPSGLDSLSALSRLSLRYLSVRHFLDCYLGTLRSLELLELEGTKINGAPTDLLASPSLLLRFVKSVASYRNCKRSSELCLLTSHRENLQRSSWKRSTIERPEVEIVESNDTTSVQSEVLLRKSAPLSPKATEEHCLDLRYLQLSAWPDQWPNGFRPDVIEVLDLSENALKTLVVPGQPEEWRNLRELKAAKNPLQSVDQTVFELPSLRLLFIPVVNYDGLPFTSLLKSTRVKIRFDCEETTEIAEERRETSPMKHKTSIVTTDNISSRRKTAKYVQCFVEAFCSTAKTKSFVLRNSGLRTLPQAVSSLSPTVVDLSGNAFEELPPLVCDFAPSLRSLRLSDNKLQSLSSKGAFLVRLQQLVLRNNEIASLPTYIGSLLQLEELDLYNNRLEVLPKEIEHLSNLSLLSVGRNRVRSPLPSLQCFPRLKRADFHGNKVTTLVGFFSAESSSILQIGELDLSHNTIEEISKEVANARCLEVLNVSHNRLTTIPVEIVQLPILQQLYLSGNKLVGPFQRVAFSVEETMRFVRYLREELNM